ncbi:hypothetical protein [Jidongwangia harbinensis]|uniref:hypothetical protein n=1 Tax=Jidongwangia harbinensis TaxID=2878561 RepID=UPI001CD9F98B|nr:hypothetical protein [Jidongwangia harbinensis]MCA2212527.1 hypothetical protein [Jidongwangia harbinensis]
MFPYTDPQTRLDLYHQRNDELRREAAAYRLAHGSARAGRHRRFGRAARKAPAVRAPSAS